MTRGIMKLERPGSCGLSMVGLLGTLLLGSGVLLSQGCAEERSIAPVPTSYRATLLTTNILIPFPEYVVRTVDLSTGTVIGETPIDIGGDPRDISVTPDGRYGAVCQWRGRIQVFDLQSLSVVHELEVSPPGVTSLHLLPVDPLKLFVTCPILCNSAVYDASTGAVDTSLPRSLFSFDSPDQRELVSISSGGVTRRLYGTWEIVDSFSFVSPVGGGVKVNEAEVTSAYDAIYLLGEDAGGGAIFRYNLSDHSCTFRQPVESPWRHRLAVSSTAGEIWVLGGGAHVRLNPREIEYWEYILILDGSNGTPLDTISTMGLLENYPESQVGMRAIAFHPEEPIAYVATQSELSVLVINRSSREIVGSLDVGIVSEIRITPSRNTSGHY